jgi:membrane protease YdiL (CAAX protease family)
MINRGFSLTTENLWLRVILFFVICVILIFSLQVFFLPLAQTLMNTEFSEPVQINIIRAMNGIVGIGLVYAFLRFDRQKMDVVGFKWDNDLGVKWILLSIPIAIIGLIPTVFIESIGGIVKFNGLLDLVSIFLTLLVTIFAIGLGEEILFRGYLQTLLETKYSFLFSASLSAFLFGLLHFLLWSPTGKVNNMIAILFSATAIGLTFSYIFKSTNYNLIFAVSIHGFWDFFLFIFQADFIYEGFFEVILEIIASIIGATVIFLLVYEYNTKTFRNYLNKDKAVTEEERRFET